MSFKTALKLIFHLVIIIILTAITQIGGLVHLVTFLFISKRTNKYRVKRVFTFILVYVIATFLIIPFLAPPFGRVKIEETNNLNCHNFITKLCNRNYVTPKMKNTLEIISTQLNAKYPELKLIYLDANFPFFDGFPLLPHLIHNDGKKIDISFIYLDENNILTNLKPSNSGYGVFEEPLKSEINQNRICKEKDYWQYDFTKYLSLGGINTDLRFSKTVNKELIKLLTKNKNITKIFIEPHLKERLNLKSQKIRFHGCRAVRHDDHIHFQIK